VEEAMPRVKLTERENYRFHCTVTVQPRDINVGGHLGYDALVSLVASGQSRMLQSLGLSERDLGDGKTGILMADLVVNYRAEAFMFDELRIDTDAGQFTRKGFRIFHRATKGKTVIALMETGYVAFDTKVGALGLIPATFINALAQ
jgi:acyl-CoA thioester hydrolase